MTSTNKPIKNLSNAPTVGLRKRKKITSKQDLLYVPPIPGMHLRWVLADDANMIGRITYFEEELAYTKVTNSEIGREGDGIVTNPAGGGKTYILMKTPIEEFEWAQKIKSEENQARVERRNIQGANEFADLKQTIET
jgi:hypothetical protein